MLYSKLPSLALLLFFIIEIQANSCPNKDSIIPNTATERIVQSIQLFNLNKKEIFKYLIKEYCTNCKCIKYLDEVEIVAEPMLQMNANCIESAPNTSLYKYFFKKKDKDSSIYNCIGEPIIDMDTLIISFRLYNKNKELTDYINLTYHMNGVLINTDKEYDLRPMASQVNFKSIDTISHQLVKKRLNVLYRTPYNYVVFNLNIHNISMERFVIHNQKIYSIKCLMRKFNSVFPDEAPPKEKYLEEIMSYPEDKLCDCDIDNYLTEPK